MANCIRWPHLRVHLAHVERCLLERYGPDFPGINCRESYVWPPGRYEIAFHHDVIARGVVQPGCVLAIPARNDAVPPLGTTFVTEPVLKSEAYWVRLENHHPQSLEVFALLSPEEVIATHVEAIAAKISGPLQKLKRPGAAR